MNFFLKVVDSQENNTVKKLWEEIEFLYSDNPSSSRGFLFVFLLDYDTLKTIFRMRGEIFHNVFCCFQGLNFYLWVYPCNLCQDFVVKWYFFYFFLYIHTSFVTWWYNINDILIRIFCWLSFDSWIQNTA